MRTFSGKATRLMALLLTFVMLSGLLGLLPATADSGGAGGAGNTGTETAGYKQKVIAVVYDNSGSMVADKRIEYAKYSLQILLSMVDAQDELVIVAMNEKAGKQILTPDLKTGDRSAVVRQVMNEELISSAFGSATPYNTVTKALTELEKRGMQTTASAGDGEAEKEYWLVVLTDGSFQGLSVSSGLEDSFRQSLSPYSGLHTVYLGIGKSANDLSGGTLKNEVPFTPLKAANASDLIAGMQTITSLMSGKYSLPTSSYEVNGNVVTLDFSKLSFPFRNISVLVQNCAVTLAGAQYNGADIRPTQYSVISGNTELGIANGFSAAFFNANHFSGGRLVLTFSGPIDKNCVTFLGEPALSVEPYFEYRKGSGWVAADINYINSNLTKKDIIRVSTRIYEQAGHTEVSKDQLRAIFGDCTEQVLYNGKNYAAGESIPLALGKNELSVSVSMMNGAYKLSKSYVCAIAENPTYYRIESEAETRYGGDRNKIRVLYTVYEDNLPLTSAAALSSYRYEVKATLADGTDVPLTVHAESNGRISAVADVTGLGSGVVRFSCKVTSSLNISRTKTDEVNAWVYHTLGLAADGGTFSLSFAELFSNSHSLRFRLTADGDPGNLADGSVAWTVTVDGTEMTSGITAQGDTLIFTPTFEALGAVAGKNGQKKVTVRVWCPGAPQVSATAEAFFTLTPSVLSLEITEGDGLSLTPFQLVGNQQRLAYRVTLDGAPLTLDAARIGIQAWIGSLEVSEQLAVSGNTISLVPTAEMLGEMASQTGDKAVRVRVFFRDIPEMAAEYRSIFNVRQSTYAVELLPGATGTVNRFRISESGAAFSFRVIRDGVALTKDELQKAWDDKTLRLSGGNAFFLPYGTEVSIEEEAGEGVLRCRVVRDQPILLGAFTAMLIFNGERRVTLSCGGAEATETLVFPGSNVLQYVWRILIILIILYLIAYFVCGRFFSKHFRRGKLVTLNVTDRKVTVQVKSVNRTFAERYLWHLKRFVPWHLAMNQPDLKGLTFKVGEEEKGKRPRIVARFRMKSSPIGKIVRVVPDGDTTQFNQFRQLLKKQNNANLDMTPEEVRALFTIGDEIGVNPKMDSSYYATLNRAGNIVRIQFYIFM